MWNLVDVLGKVAKRRETTHAATALAWLLAKPETSSIIVGARNTKQLDDNLKALTVKLSAEDVKELDEASAPSWEYPYDFISRVQAW
jgi:aryl-alcohol dehydrogenase-like predicted oxidoreductase